MGEIKRKRPIGREKKTEENKRTKRNGGRRSGEKSARCLWKTRESWRARGQLGTHKFTFNVSQRNTHGRQEVVKKASEEKLAARWRLGRSPLLLTDRPTAGPPARQLLGTARPVQRRCESERDSTFAVGNRFSSFALGTVFHRDTAVVRCRFSALS